MTWTDNGSKVKWDWCPTALANGMEWGLTQRRYESLYRVGLACRVLYVAGWILGKVGVDPRAEVEAAGRTT